MMLDVGYGFSGNVRKTLTQNQENLYLLVEIERSDRRERHYFFRDGGFKNVKKTKQIFIFHSAAPVGHVYKEVARPVLCFNYIVNAVTNNDTRKNSIMQTFFLRYCNEYYAKIDVYFRK